jgi:HEAT repeat protein
VLQDVDLLHTHHDGDAVMSLTLVISTTTAEDLVCNGHSTQKINALDDLCQLGPKVGQDALKTVIGALLDKDQAVSRRALIVLKSLASQHFGDDDDFVNCINVNLLLRKSDMTPHDHKILCDAGIEILASSAEKGVNQSAVFAVGTLTEKLLAANAEKGLLLNAMHTLSAIAEPGNQVAISTFRRCLSARDDDIRLCSVRYLGHLTTEGNQTVLSMMLQCLQDSDPDVSNAAVATLGAMVERGNSETIAYLTDFIKNGHGGPQRAAAMKALAHVCAKGEQGIVSLITQQLDDDSDYVRLSALRVFPMLVATSDSTSIRAVIKHIRDANPDVRLATVKCLSRFADSRDTVVIDALKRVLSDEHNVVRSAAKDALMGSLEAENIDLTMQNTPSSKVLVHHQLGELDGWLQWWSQIQDAFGRCSQVKVHR